MADPFISVGTQMAVERVGDSITNELGYVRNYKTNFENLDTQLQQLKDTYAEVKHRVDEANRNGDGIEQKVVNWLGRVEKIDAEATKIIEDNNQANMRCFKSLCPDLKKRYQHSKKAARKTDNISKLLQEGKFDRVSYHTIPKETWHPSSKLYEDFESRMSTLKNVINALSSPNVNMVGVYGMGGIGKTTLAREVGRKVEEGKLFDSVHFVEISEQPDVMKIQGEIAGRLGLTFRVEDQYGKAMELCERLKQERKVLLILDNIWESLDLVKVGIPLNDDHRGCKLLLTARNTNVLLKMDCQSNFPVGILNEKEALKLFEKVAGSCVQHHDLQSLAFDVAKRCGGLPIAVVTVAKALKNKQVSEWENALIELQRPSSESQDESVTQEAYSCILLSYNHLKSDELKSTFLLCCTVVLIGDATLEELLRYGWSLNLFKRIKTMEEARHRVNTLMQKLKDSSLLLETAKDECFSIHDVVRDVGRAIALSNHKNFIVDDIRVLLDTNTWENCTSISLLDIAELPKELNCPHLTFFYMKTKTKFSIPNNFFNGMPKLEVLHLKEMDLSELPASLSSLEKLRTLYLYSCNLGDITIIGDVMNLEILVLFNSQSAKKLLSEAIGKLNRLRLLDLRGSSFIFPPKTISRLTQLEELYMDDWYDQQQVEELNIETGVASLEELKDLYHLTALRICVADVEILPKCMVFQKLKRYNILIGDKRVINYETYLLEVKSAIRETVRTLRLSSDANLCSKDGVMKQLKGIEYLLLRGEQRITNILCELDGEGFPKLRHFHISNNPFILCIVDSMLSATCVAFPLLETLSLLNLVRLEKICHEQLKIKCFCQLRTIKVQNCHKLKNLFSFSIAEHLSVLQKIQVDNCRNMEEIFIVDKAYNGGIDPVFFEQLHSLTLRRLPRLRRICSKIEVPSTSQKRWKPLTTNASSSEIVLEDQIDTLLLLDEKVVFPNLKHLNLYDINLKYTFSSSTLGSFNHLQFLDISDCKDLEELIRIDDKCNNYVEFPSLERLNINNCSKLREFIFSEKVSCPSLQEIRISNMANLRRIWQSQVIQSVEYYPKLDSVYVEQCLSLENIFPASVARRLLQLKLLSVWDCGIKEIVAKEGVEEAAVRFSFPQLTSLYLNSLEELSCFYPGKHTTEWPKLKELKVRCSEKIYLFSFQKHAIEGQLDEDHTMSQPLFLVDQVFSILKQSILSGKDLRFVWNSFPKYTKVFSNTKRLKLSGNDIGMMWQSQFPEHIFPKLKCLDIYSDTSIVFPFGSIFQRFHNLEKLELTNCSYEEIFSYEEIEKYAWSPPQIKCLRLASLRDVKQMWKRDSKLNLLENLESLEVERCESLNNVLLPSSSFGNLKIMKINNCRNLISLLVASTTKSLVQLEEMQISRCEMMTQVVANGGDTVEDKITFYKLKKLELKDLSCLTSFSFGNYTFEIPVLEKLSVKECPKMEIFTLGNLSTPMLYEVWQDQTEYICKDDLNKIVQQHHEEMIFSRKTLGIKDIKMTLQKNTEHQKVFSNLLSLTFTRDEISVHWQSQFPQQLFPNLKFLRVFEDESTVFPLAILQRFRSVERLILFRSSYEEIFSCEDFGKYAGVSAQIKSLGLYQLDNLKQMWKQDSSSDLILPNIEYLRVKWCGSLVTLVPPLSSFRNLTQLIVMGCDGLMNLLAPATAKSMVQLERMDIRKCKTMTEVISSNEEAITDDEIIFNKLQWLQLDGLSSLTSFCPRNFTFTFPDLRFVSLKKCLKIKFFSSGVLNTPKLKEISQDETTYYCYDGLNATIQRIHEELNVKTSPEDCAGPSTPSLSAS